MKTNWLYILTHHMTRVVSFIPFDYLFFFFVLSLPPHLDFLFFVLQRCSPRPPHHSLNLSIFCHGEKHLNLSPHLFITCHLCFLLLLPFLSPPLHLCVFPAARLLLMPFASSFSIGLRSNANFLQSLIFIVIIFVECNCSCCKEMRRGFLCERRNDEHVWLRW